MNVKVKMMIMMMTMTMMMMVMMMVMMMTSFCSANRFLYWRASLVVAVPIGGVRG